MATATQGTPRTRRIRAGQDERRVARAEARTSAPIVAIGAIIHGYDASDRRLFQVVRPATVAGWRDITEPTARIGDFRAWLRSKVAGAVVGVAASAERDPIATWLRETGRETRGYGRVIVRAGQSGYAGEGTRAAHFEAYDRRGYPLGMGYLDMGLTLALDWLDGAGLAANGAPRLLTAGEVSTMLMEMSAAWPSPDRQALLALTAAQAAQAQDKAQATLVGLPHIVRRVGIAGGR